ncbi:hypothetical protein AAH979_41195 [Plantactinospora sp. ZYX-F-223]|uniref:hypothetical protein n=1 Tax=Plantactinospora sp. ZYX-F-223 TaxID=3144103 RepID=UPI0031FDC05D
MFVDGGGEVAVGAVAAVGGEVVPEDRAEYMAGEVEHEGLLQPDQGLVVALLPRLGESVEGVVAALDLRGVVLAVVQLQDLAGHGGFERASAQRNLFNRLVGLLHHCLTNRTPHDENRAFPPSTD